MIKIDKKRLIVSIVISFIYVSIGTYDNLTGLHFEKFLNNTFCNSSQCELLLLVFYSQSYLYGALFCAFFGGSNIAFIFCQIIVFMVVAGVIYLLGIIIRVIQKIIFNSK